MLATCFSGRFKFYLKNYAKISLSIRFIIIIII